jgi:4-amino-4-deoxy-L-arabinose transferase-like glycosyltransferase
MLTGLGGRPVRRTQEARVLEVARQMLGKPVERWMVPRINDRLRLRKPPLAYWAAAGAYTVAGRVSEAAGRVPTVLASWLTLAGAYLAGAWLFNRRAGMLAAAALLSSYLFFWHARLAETDPWATLFVTFGTLAFWKAVAPETFAGGTDAGARRQAVWFHAGAACVALATLSKGAPALFPILFLIGLSLLRRRPRALWLFVRCGAPLTMVAPGLLWLWYASKHADLGQIGEEFSNNWRGEGHGAPFFAYLYMLPMAALPWTGVMAVAIVGAVRRCRADARLQGLLVWAASVLLPLFVTGNKQPHYLMMVMPCLMVITGWALDESLGHARGGASRESPRVVPDESTPVAQDYASDVPVNHSAERFAGAVATVFGVTVGVCGVAALAAPLAAKNLRGSIRPVDFAVGGGIAVAMGAAAWAGRRKGPGAAAAVFAAAWAVALTVANAWWWPSVEPNDPRAVAADMRRVAGDGPYCSYGTVVYLPLCFALRAEVPAVFDAEELRKLVAERPGVHVILRRRVRDKKTLPDPDFVRELEVRNDDAVFELYRYGKQ